MQCREALPRLAVPTLPLKRASLATEATKVSAVHLPLLMRQGQLTRQRRPKPQEPPGRPHREELREVRHPAEDMAVAKEAVADVLRDQVVMEV